MVYLDYTHLPTPPLIPQIISHLPTSSQLPVIFFPIEFNSCCPYTYEHGIIHGTLVTTSLKNKKWTLSSPGAKSIGSAPLA